MNYCFYKFEFQESVHLGISNIEDADISFPSDRIFSALFIEAMKNGTDIANDFLNIVKSGKIFFSDAFPYIGGTYYIPKPCFRIESDNEGNSIIKKAYKKLKYIPIEEIDVYLNGKFDVLNDSFNLKLGYSSIKSVVAIRGLEESLPYNVGSFTFNEGNGLYVIVAYEKQEDINMTEELLEALSYNGIGGKKSSGFGKFTLKKGKINENLVSKMNSVSSRYMTLSSCLPKDEELDYVIENADYILEKRSGFVDSINYSENQQRKRDLYVFKAGSCFKNTFTGDIYNVATEDGNHPVYRYAKPMFMGVGV